MESEQAAVEEKMVAVEETAAEKVTATEMTPAAGKYQWDGRTEGDADKDVQGEAINKYSW